MATASTMCHGKTFTVTVRSRLFSLNATVTGKLAARCRHTHLSGIAPDYDWCCPSAPPRTDGRLARRYPGDKRRARAPPPAPPQWQSAESLPGHRTRVLPKSPVRKRSPSFPSRPLLVGRLEARTAASATRRRLSESRSATASHVH